MRFLATLLTLAICVTLLLTSGIPAPQAQTTELLAKWQTDGTPVSTETGPQMSPELVPDDTGGVIITWSDVRFGNQDIYAQRVNADGDMLWTIDGVSVTTNTDDQIGPRIVATGNGGTIIVSTDERNGGNNFDIYAQKLDVDGNPQWTVDGVTVSTAAFDQAAPALVYDGAGGAIIAWKDRRTGTDNDIYAQRVNSYGRVEWASDGIPVAVTPETQTEVQAVSGITGQAIFVWRDHRDADGEIYAQCLDLDGTALWTPNGLAVSNGARILGTIRFSAATDGENGCIATWTDQRTTAPGIYAQRVRESGLTAWPADVPLSLEPFSSSSGPTVVPDGHGGVIAAWHDYRSTNSDIYAQRMDSTGSALWTANGVAVVDTVGTQAFFDSAPTPTGAIVVWRDDRSGDPDLYAQLLDLSGAKQWESQGTPVCTVAGYQTRVRVAPGLGESAIAVWEDYRGLDSDIYASTIGSALSGLEMGTVLRGPLTLLANAPNPFPARTAFRFALSQPADVTIEVFDLRGRRIWESRRSAMGLGTHSIPFVARQRDGRRLPDGVYFYQVSTPEQTRTSKLVIIR